MVLAPLPRLALIHQKITPALVSFDSLNGITIHELLVWRNFTCEGRREA